jgi:hypothetical protein
MRQIIQKITRLMFPFSLAIGVCTIPGVASGDEARADISSDLRRQVGYCWKGSAGLPADENTPVTVAFSLKSDGSLEGDVSVLQPKVGGTFLEAKARAITAVRNCAPYKLPKERHAQWRDIILTFDEPGKPNTSSLVS